MPLKIFEIPKLRLVIGAPIGIRAAPIPNPRSQDCAADTQGESENRFHGGITSWRV